MPGALGPRTARSASATAKRRSPSLSSSRATPRPSTASGTWATIREVPARPGTASTSTSACPTPTTCGRSIRTARTPSRAAADRRRDRSIARDPDQTQLTTLVHRARRAVHREEQGPAVLPLRAAQHAPRAAVRLGQVQGQDRAGAVRRRDHGDRLVGRPDPGGARTNTSWTNGRW